MFTAIRKWLLRQLIKAEIEERGLDTELIQRAIRDIDAMQDARNWFLIFDVPTDDGGKRVVVCYDQPHKGDDPWDNANNIWANLCQLADLAGFEVPND